MAALAANTQRIFVLPDTNELPVLGAAKIWEGSAVGVQVTTGVYARPLNATDRFVGFSIDPVDNSAGASGALTVRLRRKGFVRLSVTGADNTKQGAGVYASSDNDFTLTSAGNSKIGWIDAFESGTTCIVYFDANLANTSA